MKAINRANLHLQNITVILARALVVAGVVACVGSGFAQTLSIQSGSSIDVAQPAQPDSIVQLTAEAQGLSLVPPDALPKTGTFWLVMPGIGGGVTAPLPCPPNDASFPIYQIADGQFLVDATDGQVAVSPGFAGRRAAATTVTDALEQEASSVVNLITRIQTSAADQQTRATMQAMGIDVPSPGDGSSDTNGIMANGLSSSLTPDYGTNLWIAQVTVLSGNLNGIGTNTQADIQYDIMSRTNLLQSDWQYEGSIFGSETTNWTSLTVSQNGRPILFLQLRSDADDGSGLPIWWQLQYFGTTGLDPFSFDPSGDGFTLLDAFLAGLDPTVFNTPAAPKNLKAQVDNSGLNVTLSWQSGGGNVSQYHVEELYGGYYSIDLGTVPASQTNFNATLDQVYFGTQVGAPSFRVTAEFANGYSSASATIDLETSFAFPLQIIRNSQGQFQLIVGNLPADATLIHLFWSDDPMDPATIYYDVPVTNIVNGVYTLPENVMETYAPQYDTVAEILRASGQFDWEGSVDPDVPSVTVAEWLGWLNNSAYFLKDNLHFLLRSATINHSFSYDSSIGWNRSETGPTHEYSGYHYYSSQWGTIDLDATRPMYENYLWRNFAYVAGDLNTGATINGGERYIDDPEYQIQSANLPPNAVPSPLLTDSTSAFYFYSDVNVASLSDIGLGYDANGYLYLPTGVQNLYGLPILAVKDDSGAEVDAGAPATLLQLGYYWYIEAALSSLTTVNYYFTSQTPYIRFNVPMPAAPGNPAFSPTNTSPLLITGVGQPIGVMEWAKQSINGNNNKFAYLEQFFDQAYTEDANGVATTNKAGFLSAYGSFFPMVPGPAALVTMPDVDTGARGTCTVSVASIVLDANNDGTMDTSFNGPDTTSQVNPDRIWVNNDDDAPGVYGGLDHDVDMFGLSPDYNYSDPIYGNGQTCIHSQRDLEDYFRLWICGVPALTNAGYQVTLSWANVSSGNPVVKFFQSIETNGGTLYLTDTNVAAAQAAVQTYVLNTNMAYYIPGPGVSIGTVSNGATFTFPASYFTNSGNKYFLFEGAGIGAGELVMTILQNGNTIAQTGVWLDLHDIKDFYEQAEAINVPSNKPPSSLVSQCSVIHTGSGMGNETKQVIVYVHGINRPAWGAQNEGETLFKRLYWSGYHGRFAEFRWPCAYLPPNSWWPYTFNESEFWAYKCAPAFKNYLSYLQNRPDLAGYAVDVLAHSQGNAVVSEALSEGATVNNYILTQGAVPAHCYDGSAPTLQVLLDAETSTLNGATGVPTPFAASIGGYNQCWTNISGNVGNMVNFFNTNDFALATGSYGPFDANWVKNQQSQKPEAFAGGPSYIYYPSNQMSIANFLFGIGNYTVTDWEESRSMVARSRTSAIGAQGPATGQTSQGIIGGSVDLAASFQFGRTRDEHSAQFTRPIQTVWGYYDQILRSFQIQPINRQ
jgi:hypothetical protein